MARGLAAMGMNMGCAMGMNRAPCVRFMYIVNSSSTYHIRFFTLARELRALKIFCPALELWLFALTALMLVSFLLGISNLASLVFSLTWFVLDLGFFIGKWVFSIRLVTGLILILLFLLVSEVALTVLSVSIFAMFVSIASVYTSSASALVWLVLPPASSSAFLGLIAGRSRIPGTIRPQQSITSS